MATRTKRAPVLWSDVWCAFGVILLWVVSGFEMKIAITGGFLLLVQSMLSEADATERERSD